LKIPLSVVNATLKIAGFLNYPLFSAFVLFSFPALLCLPLCLCEEDKRRNQRLLQEISNFNDWWRYFQL